MGPLASDKAAPAKPGMVATLMGLARRYKRVIQALVLVAIVVSLGYSLWKSGIGAPALALSLGCAVAAVAGGLRAADRARTVVRADLAGHPGAAGQPPRHRLQRAHLPGRRVRALHPRQRVACDHAGAVGGAARRAQADWPRQHGDRTGDQDYLGGADLRDLTALLARHYRADGALLARCGGDDWRDRHPAAADWPASTPVGVDAQPGAAAAQTPADAPHARLRRPAADHSVLVGELGGGGRRLLRC